MLPSVAILACDASSTLTEGTTAGGPSPLLLFLQALLVKIKQHKTGIEKYFIIKQVLNAGQ
jgi:hypothetical protein